MEKGGEKYGTLDDSRSSPFVRELLKALAKDVRVRWEFRVSKKYDLSSDTQEELRRISGLIDLDNHESPSPWSLILQQFKKTLFWVQVAVAVVSLAFAIAWYDSHEVRIIGIAGFLVPLLMLLQLIAFVAAQIWNDMDTEEALIEALYEIQSEQEQEQEREQEQAKVIRDEGEKNSSSPFKNSIVELKVGAPQDKLHGEVEQDSSSG